MLLSHVVANDASFCFTCLLFLTFGPPLFSVCTLGQKSKNDHADIYTYGWNVISDVQDLSHCQPTHQVSNPRGIIDFCFCIYICMCVQVTGPIQTQ